MGLFDKDIITRDPYDDYRQTSILFIKRQFVYDRDLKMMLWDGRVDEFCSSVDKCSNSLVNRGYNTSHGVKEEHISINHIGDVGHCKYFQIYSHITTPSEYTFKLYSMCFCMQPDPYGGVNIIWADEVENLTTKELELFETIK